MLALGGDGDFLVEDRLEVGLALRAVPHLPEVAGAELAVEKLNSCDVFVRKEHLGDFASVFDVDRREHVLEIQEIGVRLE